MVGVRGKAGDPLFPDLVPPPAMGAPAGGLTVLADAPGTYVHQR